MGEGEVEKRDSENSFLDASECSVYASEGDYVPLLFKSFLTFVTKQFAITYYKSLKLSKINKIKSKLAIFTS